MATTTKTLTPTNQTVTLPDMTERPDASVLVDGIGKEADAINTLNSNISALNLIKGSVSNANDDLDNGVYYTTSATQNVPNTYGVLLNLKSSGTNARRLQLMFQGTNMWYRYGQITNNVLTWESWMKVTATAVT